VAFALAHVHLTARMVWCSGNPSAADIAPTSSQHGVCVRFLWRLMIPEALRFLRGRDLPDLPSCGKRLGTRGRRALGCFRCVWRDEQLSNILGGGTQCGFSFQESRCSDGGR
jgi:hypothetical protein